MQTITDTKGIKPEKEDSNALAAIAYLPIGGWLIPILIYLLAKNDRFARFHALNCIGLHVLLMLAGIAGVIVLGGLWLASLVLGIATAGKMVPLAVALYFALIGGFLLLAIGTLALYCYYAYRAYKGEAFSIPLVTKYIIKFV